MRERRIQKHFLFNCFIIRPNINRETSEHNCLRKARPFIEKNLCFDIFMLRCLPIFKDRKKSFMIQANGAQQQLDMNLRSQA